MQPLQFQQPLINQPTGIPQYLPQKSYDEILKDVQNIGKKDSYVSQLLTTLSNQASYPLTIDLLNWNKAYNIGKANKKWGGCVTESMLLINNHRMPIIRKQNNSNQTWNVSLDSIPIYIGNQENTNNSKQIQTISLKEYLTNFNNYASIPAKLNDDDEKKSNIRNISLLSSVNENTAIMNNSVTLLPIDNNDISFNIATFNNKTSLKNPSCLYIISIPNIGTSSVIIEGNLQKVFYNNYGKKSLFNINKSILLNNNNNKCITIIQIPLKQKTRKQIEIEHLNNKSSSWGITSWFSSSENKCRIFDVLPNKINDDKVKQLLDVYGYNEKNDGNAVKGMGKIVLPSVEPTYCCTRKLNKSLAQSCYGEQTKNVTVSCDGCSGSYSGDDIIWHCPDTIKELHPNGYDLCDKCAQKQINFDEFRGLNNIKRDGKYPIKITLLYYRVINNGIINEQVIHDIINQLRKTDNLGKIQSNITTIPPQISSSISPSSVNIASTPIIIKPIIKVNPNNFKLISNILKQLNIEQYEIYLKLFHRENVCDKDLLLLNDNDLNILFPLLGAKIKFRSWLNKYKLQQQQINSNNNVNIQKYSNINNIFSSLKILNASQYVHNFQQNNINDDMLMYLKDDDLMLLIPDMRARILFREYLFKQKQQQNNINISANTQTMQSVVSSASPNIINTQKFLF